MGKNLDPKCKQCRRIGDKLFLKGERCKTPKCAMVKRNYAPGFHGSKGKKRSSDYGLQLNEKQKARKQYNLMEKQFKLTFIKAQNKGGNTGENFLTMLEMRFDNVVYRLGLAASRPQAQQLINHGHFDINDKKLDIPSYQVKVGDVIKIRNTKKDSKIFKDLKEKLAKQDVPGWINFEVSELKGKILHAPKIDDLKTNFNLQMIVEYYSR